MPRNGPSAIQSSVASAPSNATVAGGADEAATSGAGAAAWVPAPYLLPAAMAGAVLGFVGVLVARGMREQAAFAVLASTFW